MKNVKTARISARITPEMDAEFDKVAKVQRRTKSEIARSLIEEYIRRYEKADGE